MREAPEWDFPPSTVWQNDCNGDSIAAPNSGTINAIHKVVRSRLCARQNSTGFPASPRIRPIVQSAYGFTTSLNRSSPMLSKTITKPANTERSQTQSSESRSGAAMVEFALTLPLMLIIMLGTIESCSMIHMKQTLQIAAYEAARISLVPKTTPAQVEYAATQILTDRNVRNAVITISPANFTSAPISSFITVTIQAPANDNFAVPLTFYKNRTITGTCSMMKEY